MDYSLSHLRALEAEAVHIMREVVAERERPVLLFSGGKDSLVLLRLAEKAFRPGRFPFPIMHIDTGHNFPEAIEFRDRRMQQLGERLIVAGVEDSIDAGGAVEGTGPRAHRDEFGQWDPKNQRPELWNLYNTRIHRGEHLRVFPISNWTEMDVWQYILAEEVEVPSIYLAHERQVFERDGLLYAASEFLPQIDGEEIFTESVRFRTVGDMTVTGALKSYAATIAAVIAENMTLTVTERGSSRADDRVSEAAMEDRKKQGYF